jgi:hypothetical protein
MKRCLIAFSACLAIWNVSQTAWSMAHDRDGITRAVVAEHKYFQVIFSRAINSYLNIPDYARDGFDLFEDYCEVDGGQATWCHK